MNYLFWKEFLELTESQSQELRPVLWEGTLPVLSSAEYKEVVQLSTSAFI